MINLWQPWTNCIICDADCTLEFFVPVSADGFVVDSRGDEWCGQPVCRKHANLRIGYDVWMKR